MTASTSRLVRQRPLKKLAGDHGRRVRGQSPAHSQETLQGRSTLARSANRTVRGQLRRASGRALGGAENSPLPRSPIDLVAGRGPQVVALGEDGHITERGPGGEFNGVEQGDGRALLALGDGFSAVARSDGVELQFASAFTGVNRGTRLAGDFTALATSPDSRRLVTAGREVATLSLESTLRTDTIGTGTIAFGARNDVLAFGGNFADQSRLGRAATPSKLLRSRRTHPGRCACPQTGAGRHVCVGSDNSPSQRVGLAQRGRKPSRRGAAVRLIGMNPLRTGNRAAPSLTERE